MRFYTIKSRVTGLYLNGSSGFKSRKPVYYENCQVSYWINLFTTRKESYKLEEMVLESYDLSEPRQDDSLLKRKRDKAEKEEIVKKLIGYDI